MAEVQNKNPVVRIILIVLTVIIVVPLVFIGACFPIGLWGVSAGYGSQSFLGTTIFGAAWIVGIGLAIFIAYKIIRAINKRWG